MNQPVTAPATALNPATNEPGVLKKSTIWRDHAGNVWLAALYAEQSGTEWTVETLEKPAVSGTMPLVPVVTPHTSETSHLTAKLTLPKDIGLKTKISSKGTTGIKTSHIYWRDAGQNIWLAEEFKDSSGFVWTTNNLVASAALGAPPAVPVTA